MTPKVLGPGEGRILNILGDAQNIRLSSEDTNGSLLMIEQTNPPGVGIPMHVHENEDEVFHILEGSLACTVGGKSVVATAGTTVFLPRNIPHTWITAGEVPVKTILIVSPGAGAENMFGELSRLPAGPPDMAVVLEICGRYGVRFV
ncbi:MAG: cupin protein [Capsulimonas sp.]|nr:cupin protein [Capsulimonas sp.]